jgi:D-3-phosphoglycerate dehydrogenase
MPKVLITPATLAGVDAPYLPLLREAGFDVAFPAKRRQLTEDELLRELKGASAAMAGSEPYTRRVIESTPNLRVIARAGVGYDAVDLVAATERGIAVTITPGANQESVAEHTFAILLAVAKSLVTQHNAIKAGQWPREASVPLRGRTLGLAGLGRIGKAVAGRAVNFRMRILAYEPYPDQEFIKRHGVELVPFEQLLKESDFLSLHVPMGPESKHLINRRTLALMKPTAILINTARGGLVCEADLLEALKSGRIAGAALDVFEQEPPGKNPLFELDNVVLTAHTAGVDLQSRDDMAYAAARAIVRLSRGEWPAEQVVNPVVRERFRW